MSKEWNAASYHKVSAPQTEWGRRVLARLSLRGDERVVDAGCGSGKLTRELLARVPDGEVIAIDRSWNMLATAREYLRASGGSHVRFVRVELPLMPFHATADLVFSTATFHWVRDHRALFANIFAALRSGGRLFAQCGGGPNLARAHSLAEEVMRRPAFAPYFADWDGIWEFSTPEETHARLEAAGFVDVTTGLEEATTVFEDESTYREFVTTVIYNPHLSRIPDGSLRRDFIDAITALAGSEPTPFLLDYWRLNMEARRP